MGNNTPKQPQPDVREIVRKQYGAIASTPGTSCCAGSGCCGSAMPQGSLARAIGYDAQSLVTVPEGADMGLSCGNPLAMAALQPPAKPRFFTESASCLTLPKLK